MCKYNLVKTDNFSFKLLHTSFKELLYERLTALLTSENSLTKE